LRGCDPVWYKLHLVQDELYRSKLSRYIHLNPVRIRSVSELPTRRKLEILNGFKWSSYPAYAEIVKVPEWLDIGPVPLLFQFQLYRAEQS
jgi:hypothetical protein